MKFIKMHGNKNDYIFFDIINTSDKNGIINRLADGELIRNLCDRFSGIGGDGIVIITKTPANMIEREQITLTPFLGIPFF